MPNIPMLFFISNGEGIGWNKKEWTDALHDYVNSSILGEYIDLDCSHYVHDIDYKTIAKSSKAFLDKTLSEN